MTSSISVKQRAYARIEARYSCAHEKRELRARTIADGRQTYVTQCVRCGHTSSPIAKAKAEALADGVPIPAYDDNLEARWREAKSADYDQTREKLAPELKAEYEAYLQSAAWRTLRAAVLARASDNCELCGIFDAEQVHHLTYERLGSERLTDLLAVCTTCHQGLHAPLPLNGAVEIDARKVDECIRYVSSGRKK